MEIQQPQRKTSGEFSIQNLVVPSKSRSSHATGASFYSPELDLLRFGAFLLVYLHHILPASIEVYEKYFSPAVARVLVAFASACGYGLCLFFALSAYLIAELLFREKVRTGTVHIRSFYVRRVLRIIPLYLFAVALGTSYALWRGSRDDLWRMFAYLVMAGNWFSVAHGWSANFMTPLWSISVEEQFYLFWPRIAKSFMTRGVLVSCGMGVLLANTMLFVLGRMHADLYSVIWANSFVQFEMFAVGVLMAVGLTGRQPAPRPLARLLLFACAGIAWFISVYHFHAFEMGTALSGWSLIAGYALNAAGCAAIIYGTLGLNISRASRGLIYLGKISYGLYVFHMLGLACAKGLLMLVPVPELGGLTKAALGLTITIGFASLSYRFLEMPFLKMKSKYAWITSGPERATA